MRTLVLGANGQDGVYLCESLLRRGHDVVGVGRDAQPLVAGHKRFSYHALDLEQTEELARYVANLRPDVAYHFAAINGATGDGFGYESAWSAMMRVNVLALHALLETARARLPDMRIFYAGSSKIFPSPWIGEMNETTPARPTCLYSIGKLAARDLMSQYRRDHGVKGTYLIFFNHDSPRRPVQFLLAKMARAIAMAKKNPDFTVQVRTLEFWIDWGSAEEFTNIVADLGEAAYAPELVVGSGVTVYARDVIHAAFVRHGLDPAHHIVEELPAVPRGPSYTVAIDRLKALVSGPKTPVAELIDRMVAAHTLDIHPN